MKKGFGTQKTVNKEKRQKQLSFLTKILKDVARSKDNQQAICSLIEANLNKFDEDFAKVIFAWAKEKLPDRGAIKTDKDKDNLEAIDDFSQVIHNFPKLNRLDRI